LVGCALTGFGPFLPFVRLPIVGSVNYIRNGSGDGNILTILGLASLILVLIHRYRWLAVTGVISALVLAFDFINISSKMASAAAEVKRDLADNPFRGLAEAAVISMQWEIGLPVMATGTILLITAAFLPYLRQSAAVHHG
jgi:hypothetical protein